MLNIIIFVLGTWAAFSAMSSCQAGSSQTGDSRASNEVESSDGHLLVEPHPRVAASNSLDLKVCQRADQATPGTCQNAATFVCSLDTHGRMVSGQPGCSYSAATIELYKELCRRGTEIPEENFAHLTCSVTSGSLEALSH